MKSNSAIIVAGGSSSRVKSEIPKQFLKISGKELLSYSVETFSSHQSISEVIIVCHPDWLDHVKSNYTNCIVVPGGSTRQQSSHNGVNACSKKCKNVLIHDAARPFITNGIISECISALSTHDAVAPVMHAVNSLIKLENGQPGFVDRNVIQSVQTPQCFKVDLIKKVFQSGIGGTDEIGMALQLMPDIKYKFIPGSENNSKITTNRDLKITEFILQNRDL